MCKLTRTSEHNDPFRTMRHSQADLNPSRRESHSLDEFDIFLMLVTHLARSTKYKVEASDHISSLPA